MTFLSLSLSPYIKLSFHTFLSNMSTKQIDTIEERLAKRRNARNRRFQDKNASDESEIILLSAPRPTTRSLDRLPNKSSSTSTLEKNVELLPPIEQSYLKRNSLFSNEKTNSSPILQQVTEPVVISVEVNDQQAEPIITKESVAPVSSVTVQQRPQSNLRYTTCYSTPHNLSNQLQNGYFQESNSNPESATYIRQKHFNNPLSHSKSLQRAVSEQVVSQHQSKLIPLNSIFAKQNALALPYLFNKRLIEVEFSRDRLLNSTDIQQKTVWE